MHRHETKVSRPKYQVTIIFINQIEQQTRANKFEDEIRQEQEERKQEEEMKKQRRAEFKAKQSMWN